MSILDLISQNAAYFYGLVAIFSLLVGSFLNVVIHRLPIMMERAWREGLEEFNGLNEPPHPVSYTHLTLPTILLV